MNKKYMKKIEKFLNKIFCMDCTKKMRELPDNSIDLVVTTTLENDLILDPFIGSGSTAVASKQLNRKFIGFEIKEECCSFANKRLVKIK